MQWHIIESVEPIIKAVDGGAERRCLQENMRRLFLSKIYRLVLHAVELFVWHACAMQQSSISIPTKYMETESGQFLSNDENISSRVDCFQVGWLLRRDKRKSRKKDINLIPSVRTDWVSQCCKTHIYVCIWSKPVAAFDVVVAGYSRLSTNSNNNKNIWLSW